MTLEQGVQTALLSELRLDGEFAFLHVSKIVQQSRCAELALAS